MMDHHLCHKNLEESRKKLAEILKQLDNANKAESGQKEVEWCCIDQVVTSIEELQSLISWIAEKKGMPEDRSTVLRKLEQLSKIRKVLEKSASESQQYLCHLNKDISSEKEVNYEKNKPNYINNSGEKKVAHKSVSFPSVAFSYPERNSNSSYEIGLEDGSNFPSNDESNKSSDTESMNSYINKLCSLPRSVMAQSLGDLRKDVDDHHDSLGTAISEDEGLGEESRRGDYTGPNSLLEISDPGTDLISLDTNLPVKLRYKQPVSPVESNRDNVGWDSDSCCHRNSIELCLATITKLKESLQAKENEILKLKNGTQDKSNAEELQQVVNNLQQNIEELQSSTFILEKENASLKENLLEMEEAENDARLQCQRLEEKLIFLQQKDSHFQVELTETKHALKLCLEEFSLKEAEERELHSQLKFMEVLVQKYEEQLKQIECAQSELEKFELEGMKPENEIEMATKGTQTYPSLQPEDPSNGIADASVDTQASELKLTKETTGQVEPSLISLSKTGIDSGVQTDPLLRTESNEFLPPICFGCEVSACEGDAGRDLASNITCPFQQELFNRLHHLVEEDANLQQQLHQVDQINLSLWKKLHSLQFHIGECQKEHGSLDGIPRDNSDPESHDESFPAMDTRTELFSAEEKKCSHLGLLFSLDSSEEKLKERLTHLEGINSTFLKKLEMREKLYIEQERRHENWLKTEKRLTWELQSIAAEKDSLITQVTELEAEKADLSAKVTALESELSNTREKHLQETSSLTAERDEAMADLQKTIDELIVREKEYLKQIAKLKSSKNKVDDKNEFEHLKSSYVQLQIELVGYRDQMESMKQDFDGQLHSLKENHSLEENRLMDELGTFREKDDDCEKKLSVFHIRQLELESDLEARENALEEARKEFKRHIQIAEEKHKLVEAELRKKLSQMEEGTTLATKALKEERARLEKELQENIDDLRLKEEQYKSRILELESNVSQLHQELHRLTGNLHLKFDGTPVDETTSFQRQQLLNELQELRLREGELREKLDEMEKKESAYRETLEHADRIVASVERGYRNKIEELEMSERCLKQRIGYLEEVENRLRVALQKERRSSDGRKPDDLVLELAEAEKREHSLKEKVDSLEQFNRTANQKVRELEKVQQHLEAQLSDREEVAASLEKLQSEQESIKKELARLRKSENSLQLTLHQTESLLESREAEITAEIQRFTIDRRELEETINQLRSQVRDLKEKLEKDPDVAEGEVLGKDIPLAKVLPHSADNRDNLALSVTCQADDIERETSCSIPTKPERENLIPIQRSAPSVMQMVKLIEKQSSTTENNKSTRKKITQEIAAKSPEKSPDAVATPDLPDGDDHGAVGATKAEKEYSEVRMQLEECMMRAMDAMKMEMEHKSMTDEAEEEKKNTESFLPPHNFRVIQQVGSDTLLVGWEYAEMPNLEAFELYVNDQLHETVYAPDRRKAVISGLELNRPMVLSICAVSTSGQASKPQTLQLPNKTVDGFFFQDDDDDEDDDELFDDDASDKQLRPYSVEW